MLAIDLGKTGCRARCGDWSAEGPGAPGLAAPDGVERALAAIRAVTGSLPGLVDAAGVGAAGALAAPDAAAALAQRLCIALPVGRVAVASDATTSHVGALGGAAGIVLALGTGVVGVGVDEAGLMRRADGWGPWLGDEGGGAWIGLQGLRAVLAAEDGRGPGTSLSELARSRFGALTALPALLEGSTAPPRLAASFAPDVIAAAVADDAIAGAIRDRAIAALAETVLALLPASLLAITGGLAALREGLVDPLRRALSVRAPGLSEVAARGHSLDGAARIALDCHTAHEGSIRRAAN